MLHQIFFDQIIWLHEEVVYFPNSLKDKEEDAFIGPKEFVLYMMMTQTKDKLFHQWK